MRRRGVCGIDHAKSRDRQWEGEVCVVLTMLNLETDNERERWVCGIDLAKSRDS